jgi:hypothetical protein
MQMKTFVFYKNRNEVFRDLRTWVWRTTSNIAGVARRRSSRTLPYLFLVTHFPVLPIYQLPSGTALIYIHTQFLFLKPVVKAVFNLSSFRKKGIVFVPQLETDWNLPPVCCDLVASYATRN